MAAQENNTNNLKVYLERQIKEYQEESENRKALYADLLEHIEECKSQIRSMKSKEDPGFSMLSPIPVESAYQSRIERTKAQQEAFEKQKEKYLSDIRFYDSKIQEMQSQLEAYQETAAAQTEPSEKTVSGIKPSEKPVEERTSQDAPVSQPAGISRENGVYLLRKLSEIKGYLNVDRMRCCLEIEQLEGYLDHLLKELPE